MPYADPDKQKQYLADHYKDNRSTYAARSRKQRAARRAKFDALKAKPCSDCGQTYPPAVMHFHHLDPSTKDGMLSQALTRWGWDRLEAEIAKCVLLCANCHIMRHIESGT